MFLISLLACLVQVSYAQELGSGFYYDKSSKQYYSSGHPTFSIRPTSNSQYIDKIQVSIDGREFSDYKKGLQFKNEGEHLIRFKASDPVYNWSPLQSYKIYVDLTAPSSHFFWKGPFYKKGDKQFVKSKSQLFLVSQDNLSGVKAVHIKLGEKVKEVALNSPLTDFSNGENSIQYAAEDNVGNREDWKSFSFYVDDKPPKSQLKLTGVSYRNETKLYMNQGSRVQILSQDDDSGVEQIEYKVAGKDSLIYGQAFSLSGEKNQIVFRAVDQLGNQEAWQTLDVIVDSESPELKVDESGTSVYFSGSIYARPGFQLQVTANDHQSGLKSIEVRHKDKDWQATNKESYSFSKPGFYEITFRATDNVGNTSESKPFKIVIDDQGPAIDLKPVVELVPRDQKFLSGLPNSLGFSATDNSVGVRDIEVSYDGKNYEKVHGQIDLATWKKAENKLYYRAVDRLGNVGPEKSIDLIVLTRGPKVDLFVESEGLPEVSLSHLLEKNGESERRPAKQ